MNSKGKKSSSKVERRTEPKSTTTATKDRQKGEDKSPAIVNEADVKKCDELSDRLLIQGMKNENEISTTTTTSSKDPKGKDWSPAIDGILVDEVDIKKCDELYDQLMIQGKSYTRHRLPVFEKICPK
ncbi:hypothetical protein Dimus_017481 [Dionaea muscipula]